MASEIAAVGSFREAPQRWRRSCTLQQSLVVGAHNLGHRSMVADGIGHGPLAGGDVFGGAIDLFGAVGGQEYDSAAVGQHRVVADRQIGERDRYVPGDLDDAPAGGKSAPASWRRPRSRDRSLRRRRAPRVDDHASMRAHLRPATMRRPSGQTLVRPPLAMTMTSSGLEASTAAVHRWRGFVPARPGPLAGSGVFSSSWTVTARPAVRQARTLNGACGTTPVRGAQSVQRIRTPHTCRGGAAA